MGVVAQLFAWSHIDPHTTVGVFVHGYRKDDYASYSIVPRLSSNVPSGSFHVAAQMTLGETSVHVDGTVARTVFVENRAVGPQPYIGVTLHEFKQPST